MLVRSKKGRENERAAHPMTKTATRIARRFCGGEWYSKQIPRVIQITAFEGLMIVATAARERAPHSEDLPNIAPSAQLEQELAESSPFVSTRVLLLPIWLHPAPGPQRQRRSRQRRLGRIREGPRRRVGVVE